MTIRTVTLELVRKGPPHNQLLSPLTSYLAICGNHEPEEVHVPFEHATLMRKLKSLRYQGTPTDLELDKEDLRRALVGMLAGISALERELTVAQDAKLVVLELVLSASELSLIPFELVFRPGMPTRELCGTDVLILRRTRRVPASRMTWPHRPRILFAYSQPTHRVPFEEHALALRECLEPFLVHVRGPSYDVSEVAKYLTILDDASLATIRDACAQQAFTHVHLLSHGVPTDDDGKFGLQLAHPTRRGETDVVTGDRLVAALRGGGRDMPACVTIAACDAGSVGDVVFAGSSVAHDVHEGGVPLVVASQLPLSFQGSVGMSRSLYQALLDLHDPRTALQRTRAGLMTLGARGVGHVDWASLISYGALPADLDKQLAEARLSRAVRAIDSALALVDPHVGQTVEFLDPRDDKTVKVTEDQALFDLSRDHLFRALDLALAGRRAGWNELRASAFLRWAEVLQMRDAGGAAEDDATQDGPGVVLESYVPEETARVWSNPFEQRPLRKVQQQQQVQQSIQQSTQQSIQPTPTPSERGPHRGVGSTWSGASAAVLRLARDAFREQHRADGSPIALLRAAACVAFLGEEIGWQDWSLAFGLLDLRRRSAKKASDRERVHDLALVELDLLLDLVDQSRWKVDEWRAALSRAIGHESTRSCVVSLLRNGRPDAYVFHAFYRQLLRYRLFVTNEALHTRVDELTRELRASGVRTRWTAIREWAEGSSDLELSSPDGGQRRRP